METNISKTIILLLLEVFHPKLGANSGINILTRYNTHMKQEIKYAFK